MNASTAEQIPAQDRPVSFWIVLWHAYVLSIMFLLFGGVKLLLGLLDRQYDEMVPSGLFFGIGLVIIILAWRFRDLERFGWFGLIAVNGAIIVMSLFGMKEDSLNVVLLVSSLVVLTLALLPATKSRFASH